MSKLLNDGSVVSVTLSDVKEIGVRRNSMANYENMSMVCMIWQVRHVAWVPLGWLPLEGGATLKGIPLDMVADK